MGASGAAEVFSQEKRDIVMNDIIHAMAQNGLRTICVAYKDYVFTNVRQPLDTEVCKVISVNVERLWFF